MKLENLKRKVYVGKENFGINKRWLNERGLPFCSLLGSRLIYRGKYV